MIPAHNEESVIGRCLEALIQEGATQAEVVVVANGCTDRTADIARSYQARIPRLQVLETPAAGKAGALNLGDALVSAFPRIYLDADIELADGALGALIDTLTTPAAVVAAPAVAFDTTGAATVPVLFFDVFARLPYVQRGLVGLGVYGLSAAGRARFDAFPDVTADDLFVQQLFAPKERHTTRGRFVVRVPRRTADLIRVRARGTAGAKELYELGSSPHPRADDGPSTLRALAGLVVSRPWLLPQAVVYVLVMVAARLRAPASRGSWLRDDSTRQCVTTAPVAYLVTDYPKLSHTFIEREVLGLRRLGLDVRTFSVRPPDERELLSAVMRSEASATTVLVPSKLSALAGAARVAVRHPAAVARVVAKARRSGARGVRSRLWQFFYAVEAVILTDRMRAVGIRHVHVHLANNSADIARLAVHLGEQIDGPDAGWGWSLTVHGPTEFEAVERFDLAAKVESAHAVACISDFTRSQLMRLVGAEHWDKLHVVRMSVDSTAYRPTSRTSHQGPLRVLFVGRLVPEKGVPILLDVAEQFQQDGVAAEIRVVGDGPLAEWMAQQLHRRGLGDMVIPIGPVGQDAMPDEFAAADVFCLPSFQEGLPVVLMEALASGVPVVTTRINGIPELVEDGVSGFLVTPGRADLVAGALARFAADPSLRERMGRAGRIRIEADFATEITASAQRDFLAYAQRPVR